MTQRALRRIVFMTVAFALIPLCAFAETEAGGRLQENTTWSLQGSPYILKQNLIVGAGVTLTIEPGVQVLFYQVTGQTNFRYSMTVEGQLIALGTDQLPIVFTSSRADPEPGDWDAIKFIEQASGAAYAADDSYVQGSILQNAVVAFGGGEGSPVLNCSAAAPYLNKVSIRDSADGAVTYKNIPDVRVNASVFERNRGRQGGAMHYTMALLSAFTTRLIINDCTFIDNTAKNNGGAVFFSSPLFATSTVTIAGCSFQGNAAKQRGGALCHETRGFFSLLEILDCTFLYNSAGDEGSALFHKSQRLTMQDTLVAGNTGASAVSLSEGTISRCSIVNNVAPAAETEASGDGITVNAGLRVSDSNILGHTRYGIRNDASARVMAQGNYWGTTDETEISAKLYDFFEDSSKGEIVFAPYLDGVAPEAPSIPDITTTSSTSTVPETTTVPDNGTTTTIPDNTTTTAPDNGTTDTTTTAIQKTEIEADFVAGQRTGLAPLKVDFTNITRSTLPVSMYVWDFGDGASSTEQNPTHVYWQRGAFRVTLTAYATDGTTAQKTRAGYIRVGIPWMLQQSRSGMKPIR